MKKNVLFIAAFMLLPVVCPAQKVNLAGVYEANEKKEGTTKQLYAVLDFNNCDVPDFTQTFTTPTAKFTLLPENFMKRNTKTFKGSKAAGFVKFRTKTLIPLTDQIRLTNPRTENGVITVDWEDELNRKGTCTLTVNPDKSLVFKNLGATGGSIGADGLVVTCVEDRSLKEEPKVEAPIEEAKPKVKLAAKNPFTGEWYVKKNGLEITIALDLYGKSVVNNDGMYPLPCLGKITIVGTDYSYNSYTIITSFNIVGNTATVKGIDNGGGATPEIVLKYSPTDGSLTFVPQRFKTGMDKKSFPFVSVALAKKSDVPSEVYPDAGPFIGTWKSKDKTATMTLNLYEKFDCESAPKPVNGFINVTNPVNFRTDDSVLKSFKIDDDKAIITYEGGRDGNLYQATLIFNPNNEQITLKDIKLLKNTSGVEDSYIREMIFYPTGLQY